MKSNSLVPAIIISFLFSCTAKTDENKAESAMTAHMEDSLVTLWNDSWNRNDTNAIAAMFNDKSVVISSAEDVITGVDSIMKNWVNGQVSRITNLQTTKLAGASDASMAYYSGIWTLDVTNDKDSVMGKSGGSFTSAWEKQADGKWIMTTIQMGE